MDAKQPIAIFDSGVGSYSIVRVIRKVLPNEHIVYFADRLNFPYGQKAHDELKEIVEKCIKYLKDNWHPKLIIIASNTPSIQVLHELHEYLPIIGVFPPIEQAVELSEKKHIALLATKGAAESKEIDSFINSKHLQSGVVVHKVNASALVDLVEPGTFQSNMLLTSEIIKSTLDPVLKMDPLIDVMTLSSTHLPFLLEQLTRIYPDIKFIDPALEVAKQAKAELFKRNLLSSDAGGLRVVTSVDNNKDLTAKGLKIILANLGLKTKVEEI